MWQIIFDLIHNFPIIANIYFPQCLLDIFTAFAIDLFCDEPILELIAELIEIYTNILAI